MQILTLAVIRLRPGESNHRPLMLCNGWTGNDGPFHVHGGVLPEDIRQMMSAKVMFTGCKVQRHTPV